MVAGVNSTLCTLGNVTGFYDVLANDVIFGILLFVLQTHPTHSCLASPCIQTGLLVAFSRAQGLRINWR